MSITQTGNGRFYVTAETPFPYLCPECEAIIPCTEENFDSPIQSCWACAYSGPLEEFDCEWEFIPTN